MDKKWHDLFDRALTERSLPLDELLSPADPLAKSKTESFIRYVLELQSKL